MEWVDRLQGEVIGLDTAPIIYLIEEHPIYLEPMRYFFEALERGSFRAITSTVTLLEVLVQPLRENNVSLAEEYRDILLNASNISKYSPDKAILLNRTIWSETEIKGYTVEAIPTAVFLLRDARECTGT